MDKAHSNPFKGLRAYRKEDAGTLFGRERDTALIHDRLFSGKTTLLFAGSGVGKTSFLRAKLIPETEPSRRVFYHAQWTTGEPLRALRETLSGTAPATGAPLRQIFSADGMDRCILILDQFEEVFQNHAWQPCLEQFLEELCAAINAEDLQVRVLFSMREEFLGELSVFDNRIPDLFNNYYRLKHPNKRDAAEIVRSTGALSDCTVDEEGLQRLIEDLSLVERPAARAAAAPAVPAATRLHRDFVFLPYLQLVCRRLWEEAESTPADAPFLTAYPAGRAARVLKGFCREKLAALDADQKKTVAAALEYLVTGQDAKVACELRNLASLTREAPGEIDAALNRLADEDTRIVRVTRGADGSTWFELYHDLYAPILSEWKQEFESELQSQERMRSRQLVGQAELLLRTAVSMFEDDKSSGARDPVVSLSTWARLVERQGDRGGATRLLRKVLLMQEERLGGSHPDVAATLAHLARLVRPAGEAERMLRRALQIQESKLGPEHMEVASTSIDLARLLRRQRRDEDAEPLLRRALAIRDRTLGAEHPDVISLLTEFTGLLRSLGRAEEANALFRRAVNAPEESRDAELGKWIAHTAADIGQDRRFRNLLATIDTLLREIESAPEESERDRHHATILLAVDILDGRIDFARHIDPSSYWRLEDNCWLQDVKYSKAFKLWLERGGGVDPRKELEDYVKADEQVCMRLFDPKIKATADEFAPVAAYLNRRYLTGGRLDRSKSAAAKLLNVKAYHFYETASLGSEEDWNRALQYCEAFYNNIVPAVTHNSVEHACAVLNALEVRRGAERADIAVNCFEMALAVYFLDPDTVAEALDGLDGDVRQWVEEMRAKL